MRIFHSTRSLVLGGLTLLATAPLGAQVILQTHGQGWVSSLSLPEPDTLRFRWKWNGPPAAATAQWQITFANPASSALPAIVKSVAVPLPSGEGKYEQFRIPLEEIPSNAPATIYVRIRTTDRSSNWVSVTFGSGGVATTPTTPSDQPGGSRGDRSGTSRGGTTDPVRASAGTATPGEVVGALGKPAVKSDKPFVIPGGAALEMPLWVRLTEINCHYNHQEDGDDTDEMYAVVVSVKPNNSNPFNSMVSAQATKVYTMSRCNHAKQSPHGVYPHLKVWGPNNGAPIAIRGSTANLPDDAIIFAALMERDQGQQMAVMLELMRVRIREALAKKTGDPGLSVAAAIRSVLPKMVDAQAKDDWIGIGLVRLHLSDEELAQARGGQVVRKKEGACQQGVGTSDKRGCYSVEFQIGREGVAATGPALATCKDGTVWYGFSRTGVCAGHAGILRSYPALSDFKF